MYVKSSSPQQDTVVEAWTADLLVLEQALYHWDTRPHLSKLNTKSRSLQATNVSFLPEIIDKSLWLFEINWPNQL